MSPWNKWKANKMPAASRPTLASWAISARVPATAAMPRPWTALSLERAERPDPPDSGRRPDRSSLAVSHRGLPIDELTGDIVLRRRFVRDE